LGVNLQLQWTILKELIHIDHAKSFWNHPARIKTTKLQVIAAEFSNIFKFDSNIKKSSTAAIHCKTLI